MSSNLFNVDATAPVAEQPSQAANEFRPNYKKGVGGVFEAYIRFLPNPKDPANGSVISKYSAFVKNYATNAQRMVDCPSTVGMPDPIQETFFFLRQSQNKAQVEASKSFSRAARFASLVQVVNCPSDPSLNGKVLIWSFGKKINEKIQAEMNPANSMVVAKNPFNMLQGRPFYVKCKEVSGFNNFDESGFFDAAQPVYVMVPFNGTTCPVTMETVQNPQFAEAVNVWLNESAPSLDPYKYQEWDDETRQFVAEAIEAAKNPNLVINNGPAVAPAANAFGQQFAQPTAPAGMPSMGGFGMPQQPGMGAGMPGAMPGMQMPAGMPSMSMPGAAPQAKPAQPAAPAPAAAQPSATTPGGFSASNIPNVDSIMNVGAPSPAASAPAPGGININDVLGEIMG